MSLHFARASERRGGAFTCPGPGAHGFIIRPCVCGGVCCVCVCARCIDSETLTSPDTARGYGIFSVFSLSLSLSLFLPLSLSFFSLFLSLSLSSLSLSLPLSNSISLSCFFSLSVL